MSTSLDLRRHALPFCALLITSISAYPFDYFEHRYLGNRAYEKAKTRIQDNGTSFSNTLTRIEKKNFGFGVSPRDPADMFGRSLQRLPFQFGDLSALAGDFTESVEELEKTVRNVNEGAAYYGVITPAVKATALVIDTRRQWFNACKWAYRNRHYSGPDERSWDRCFDLAADLNSKGPGAESTRHTFGSEGYRASRDELAQHEAISGYVTLASQNRNHFPRHSWKSYGEEHRKALQLARQYRECSSGAPVCDALLTKALFHEGFAQHYLQDSFSAGHIGSAYGRCEIDIGLFKIPTGRFFCRPTKRRLLQTHDTLNEIGLDVVVPDPSVLQLNEDLARRLRRPWTVFGDDHLFIEEADFQRSTIVTVAAESISEIFEAAAGDGPKDSCRMCTTGIFPIPQEEAFLTPESKAMRDLETLDENYPAGDLVKFEAESWLTDMRSLDPRVPAIPVEGWKLGFGFVTQALLHGNGSGGTSTAHGILLKLDYARDFGPQFPNVFGFEYWNISSLRTAYLFNTGYSRPRELSPLSLAVKLKLGWRIEENLTKYNPSTSRTNGVEVSIPSIEATWEMFKPLSLFFEFNRYTFAHRVSGERTNSFGLAGPTYILGAKLDISGI